MAGNLSPTGLSIEPAGETSFDELCRIYADQAAALDDAGVDLFVIETMLSVTEARAAVMACRKYKKPVWVTMTLDQDGMLLSGGQPLACLITLQRLGVDGFGFNCGAGIEGMVTGFAICVGSADCKAQYTAGACMRAGTVYRLDQATFGCRRVNCRRMLRHGAGAHPRSA